MAVARSNEPSAIVRRRLIIRGQVQGVGFRPFVYRLAGELHLAGFVRNDSAGVTIELQGPAELLDRFSSRLRTELPPAARIDHADSLEIRPAQPAASTGATAFQILTSESADPARSVCADVTVDLATCDDCLRELFDPADRRFGYPFINCTNCGPRYTIVRDVPYDRRATTMSCFTMCPACQAEYDDPANRRFHAQPNACPVCGPSIWLAWPKQKSGCHACDGSFVAGMSATQGEDLAAKSAAMPPEKISPQQAIAQAAEALLAGKIVAIRGVGGFHLAVRADRDDAVARLRERKGREHKPLAVMVAHPADAAKLIRMTPEAKRLMLSPARPIVVARRVDGAAVSALVAAGTDSLGVMLPYTPLHHLLFAELERQAGEEGGGRNDTSHLSGPEGATAHSRGRKPPEGAASFFSPEGAAEASLSPLRGSRNLETPTGGSRPRLCAFGPPGLVMTSGNISDEPIVAGNDEAIATLGGVADLFLLHDRDIARRIDDSVVEVMDLGTVPLVPGTKKGTVPISAKDRGNGDSPFTRDTCLPLRRARGYVPAGLDLPVAGGGVEPGLAVGGELKNTVAAVRGGAPGHDIQVILSEHIGDLKDGRVYRNFLDVIAHLLQITHVKPAWIAHDLHPMYLSTAWARRQNVKLIGVQHHHAHIAACLAEHGRTGPAIGLAADGVGYGDDGTIWGGEILLADLAGFRRVGRVRPIGLPGGDAAAVRTARPALAWLFDATAGNIPGRWLDRLMPDRAERDVVLRQLAEQINCPASSALGRYFDAAAAILGGAQVNRCEAEAPIALEAAIEPDCNETLSFTISRQPSLGGMPAMAVLSQACAAPHSEDMAAKYAAMSPSNTNLEIDLRPTVLELIGRVDAGEPTGRLAAAFHNTIAAALAEAAKRVAEWSGVRTMAASGGVFCNRYLAARLARLLSADGNLELLTHRQVPANDGGLALGQAAVAAARLKGNDECRMTNVE